MRSSTKPSERVRVEKESQAKRQTAQPVKRQTRLILNERESELITQLLEYRFPTTDTEDVDTEEKNEIAALKEKLQKRDGQLLEINKQLDDRIDELRQKNQQLQETQRSLQHLVTDYTHDVGNLIRPDIMYDIAQAIKQQFPEQFLLLDEVYQAEIAVRHRSEALRIKHTLQNPENFRVLIRRDKTPKSGEIATDVKNILNETLRHTTRQFLYYPTFTTRREQLLQNRSISLLELQQCFTQQTVFENHLPLEWVQQHLFPIQHEWSPLWEKIKLKKYGSTENLLYSYFTELFLNIFKYSDYQGLKLRFYDQDIDGRAFLISRWENTYRDNQSISTGNGLIGIREELQILNDSQEEQTTLQMLDNQVPQTFSVTLALKKDLLIYDSQPRNYPRPQRRITTCESYG
jgi:hypothetical protein